MGYGPNYDKSLKCVIMKELFISILYQNMKVQISKGLVITKLWSTQILFNRTCFRAFCCYAQKFIFMQKKLFLRKINDVAGE